MRAKISRTKNGPTGPTFIQIDPPLSVCIAPNYRTIVVGEVDEPSELAARTSKREAEKRKRMLDKMRMAAWRERKRSLDQLPKRITAMQSDGEELIKSAKGLVE